MNYREKISLAIFIIAVVYHFSPEHTGTERLLTYIIILVSVMFFTYMDKKK